MRLLLLALGTWVAWRIAEENRTHDHPLLPSPARARATARMASARRRASEPPLPM